MARSSVRGIGPLRRLMKRLPDEMRNEMIVELHVLGRELVQRMIGAAPSRTGALRRGLSYKVFPKTLRLQAGLLGTKKGRSRLFYAYILDQGRRAQEVNVTRATTKVYAKPMKVRAIAPMRFVTARKREAEERARPALDQIYRRALSKAAGGSD